VNRLLIKNITSKYISYSKDTQKTNGVDKYDSQVYQNKVRSQNNETMPIDTKNSFQ
jgi:hypothetical protein